MKKIVLSIEEIVKAKNAIDKLLQYQGIPRKKAYWLDRNRKALEPSIKKWTMVITKEIFEKFAVDMPEGVFIPPIKYPEFKKEILILTTFMVKEIDLKEKEVDILFNKYEIKAESSKGIPIEKSKEYNDAIQKAAEEFQKEIEYAEITADNELDQIMKSLSGEDQIAIEFMLEEQSSLQVFPGGILQ